MVDQMRLDHVPASSSALGSAGTSSESGALEREPPPLIRLTPDSPPRFTIRVRRNAENSASDNSPSVAPGVGNNPGPNNSTSARVILPGINPVPSVNGSYRISQQRDQVLIYFYLAFLTFLLDQCFHKTDPCMVLEHLQNSRELSPKHEKLAIIGRNFCDPDGHNIL